MPDLLSVKKSAVKKLAKDVEAKYQVKTSSSTVYAMMVQMVLFARPVT